MKMDFAFDLKNTDPCCRKKNTRLEFRSNISSDHFSIFLIIILVFLNNVAFSQGQFLRGVEKVEYVQSSKEADFYVSPKGNDNWSGRLPEQDKAGTDGPFATIGRAMVAVRNLKNEVYKRKTPAVEKRFIGTPHEFGSGRDILVLIRGGVYSPDSALIFTAADGGERVETDLPTGAFEYHELKDYYVTYAAYPGESPVISGGERITGWKKKNGGMWMAGIDQAEVNELYADGKRMTLARAPNTGFYLTDGQPLESTCFNFKNNDIKPWKNLKNSTIHLIVRWGAVTTGIKNIDVKNRIAYLRDISPDITLVPPKYYIENIVELLDTVGEWYFDKKERSVTFMPGQEKADPNKSVIVFPKLSNLISVKGSGEKPVRNLRIYNLRFENTCPGGDGTITFDYAKNCELTGNRIENVSQTAVRFGRGCYHNLISRNQINDIKGSGIVIYGNAKPEGWNDVISDNVVSYNKVTNILVPGSGIYAANTIRTTVSHNYVYNVGSSGISLGSWPNIEETVDGNHLAEFNHVSFTNMIGDDEGGIAVYGLSPGSIVQHNLIHDVNPARTNENVGFFFQNMASGWTVTNNIFFNLKQGEMKLCACYLVDNLYENNFNIEAPINRPEDIVTGKTDLFFSRTEIKAVDQYFTGDDINISSEAFNKGSTGTTEVFLYVDGKVVNSGQVPLISGNSGRIEFNYRFYDPGTYTVSVGNAASCEVLIKGEPLYIVYSDFIASLSEIPEGDSLFVKFIARNVRSEKISGNVDLIFDGKPVASEKVELSGNETREISFSYLPVTGNHTISAGNLKPLKIFVYPIRKIDVTNSIFNTYCSATARPCKFDYDPGVNHFEITAGGTDFLHAEDSYGTIYLNDIIDGNFVAKVKLVGLSKGISEWFRAGIFIRNDLSKNSETVDGTLGSFLLFSTTKRCGAQWDEFGDGCMHNTKSVNYGVDNPLPVWLKLIRHGNKFTGYYSFDGETWKESRQSGEIPGLGKRIDIGLAGGANDQRSSKVIFEDFQLTLEEKGK